MARSFGIPARIGRQGHYEDSFLGKFACWGTTLAGSVAQMALYAATGPVGYTTFLFGAMAVSGVVETVQSLKAGNDFLTSLGAGLAIGAIKGMMIATPIGPCALGVALEQKISWKPDTDNSASDRAGPSEDSGSSLISKAIRRVSSIFNSSVHEPKAGDATLKAEVAPAVQGLLGYGK